MHELYLWIFQFVDAQSVKSRYHDIVSVEANSRACCLSSCSSFGSTWSNTRCISLKTRSLCAGPIMCSFSCVLLHIRPRRPRRHHDPCASMNNGWIITDMSGYHGKELLPSLIVNILIGTRYMEEFIVVTYTLCSGSSPASHISKCHQMKLVGSDQLQVL